MGIRQAAFLIGGVMIGTTITIAIFPFTFGSANRKSNPRAWLIDLVREAIRIEKWNPERLSDPAPVNLNRSLMVADVRTVISKQEAQVVIEPSFEQMQAEALQAQEKFYEPERA